jgi:hypothetical protein
LFCGRFDRGPALASSAAANVPVVAADGFEERAMSMSVGSSSTNNPFAYLQALWQQEQSSSSTATQSNPLSQLFAAIGQQATGATASAGAASSAGATSTSGNTFPQFGAQTLQALLALQSSGNGSSPQSLWSQLGADGSTGTSDATSAQQVEQTTRGRDGHHHHHHMAAPSGGTGSSASSSSAADGANVAGGNRIEQLIQMQAQLLNPATTQSVATV